MQVQAAVDARGQAVSPVTVRRDAATLKAVLNAAVDADLIARSPARKLALPRIRPTTRKVITPAELIRLADTVPPRYRVLVLVAGVLGLRWGEAIALRVRDVDFAHRTVTVAQVIEEVAGQLQVVEGEAKSISSLRTLAAPAFLVDELARHLREHRTDDADDPLALIFLSPRGGLLRRRFAERTFRPAVARAGLDPSLTFHGLRHAAMTTLVDEKVHPRVMQSRAGHASSKLTMELYAHVTEDADRAAAHALENRFRSALRAAKGHATGAAQRHKSVRAGQRRRGRKRGRR
jgi:integrase